MMCDMLYSGDAWSCMSDEGEACIRKEAVNKWWYGRSV